MTWDQLVEKYNQPNQYRIIWEIAAFEICPCDPVYDLNRLGEEGWEPLKSINKKSWLFKRSNFK